MTDPKKPPHRGISITNRDIVEQLGNIQSALQKGFPRRRVGMQMVIDYLLQNYSHSNEAEASLEFEHFAPRIAKRWPK